MGEFAEQAAHIEIALTGVPDLRVLRARVGQACTGSRYARRDVHISCPRVLDIAGRMAGFADYVPPPRNAGRVGFVLGIIKYP